MVGVYLLHEQASRRPELTADLSNLGGKSSRHRGLALVVERGLHHPAPHDRRNEAIASLGTVACRFAGRHRGVHGWAQ